MNVATKATLFALNPAIDQLAVAASLRQRRFAQIEDALEPAAADHLWHLLRHETPYGLAWAGEGQPHGQLVRPEQMRQLSPEQKAAMGNAAAAAAGQGRFAFLYGQYPLVEAARDGWHPGHPLYHVLDDINAPSTLAFIRAVSGHQDIMRADAQATLYAGGHFLTEHDDNHAAEGRRIAYVLHMARDWRPDWGGYLNILDEAGNVVAGFMPRFNCLTLFEVPLRHNVGLVAPFAPVGRLAVTGWFRNR